MLRKLWNRWLPLAHKIGNFQSRILLTLFYFTIVLPFGVVVTLFADPLHRKRKAAIGSWLPRETHDVDLASASKQS